MTMLVTTPKEATKFPPKSRKGTERVIRPDAAGEDQHEQPRKVEWPDPQQAAHIERAEVESAGLLPLRQHQPGQKIGTQSEEQVDAEAAEHVAEFDQRWPR